MFSIYWDPYLNIFTDDEGNLSIGIFRMIDPNRLLLMKQKRGWFYERYKGEIYELVFPFDEDYDEEEDFAI